MDFEAVYLILLTASIFVTADGFFTRGPISVAIGAKVTKTFAKDKGSSDGGVLKFNAFKEHYPGDGHIHEISKDGGSIISKYDNLDSPFGQEKHYSDSDRDEENGEGNSDGYNHNYKHGYRHSHGYSRQHHSSEGQDGDGDGYHGYYRVQFDHDHDHDHDGGEKTDDGCGYDGCKQKGNHYDSGFEFHYGNDGKDRDEYNSDGNGEHNSDHSLDHDHNEGVDGYESDYHYGYTGSTGNYDKDYPSAASDHYNRHREQDHDHGGYR